jgi:hypothetical protein
MSEEKSAGQVDCRVRYLSLKEVPWQKVSSWVYRRYRRRRCGWLLLRDDRSTACRTGCQAERVGRMGAENSGDDLPRDSGAKVPY